jgi:hypothetical protein
VVIGLVLMFDALSTGGTAKLILSEQLLRYRVVLSPLRSGHLVSSGKIRVSAIDRPLNRSVGRGGPAQAVRAFSATSADRSASEASGGKGPHQLIAC